MFFDKPIIDDYYYSILVSIAKLQRKIMSYNYDWNQRKTLGKNYKECLSDLAKLDTLKKEAYNHLRKMGYSRGIYWWNIPWDHVESYLAFDLETLSDHDNWRFSHEWDALQCGSRSLIVLKEEGHCSLFSSSSSFETGIISDFTQSEIGQKVRDFNTMLTLFDLAFVAPEEQPVRGVLSNWEYDSGLDYLMSGEHFALRSFLSDKYSRSLYTNKETTMLYAQSESFHYKNIYAVGEISIKDSQLEHMELYAYKLCRSSGEVSESVLNFYSKKDAAVSCAAFLSSSNLVQTVPMRLFGKDMFSCSTNYDEAMRQAEIYTCLADKIPSEI